MRLKPFRSLRPRPELAAQVAAVPYDVVNRDEAAELAAGNPISFLHVGRSDIDLPPGTDPYDDAVYEGARQALDRLVTDGALVQDGQPAIYLYRQIMDGRTQTGVVGCVHIDDYERDVIRKHEKTRKDKEDDRTRHVLTLEANAEPVFLTYRAQDTIDRLVERDTAREPLYDFTAPDGVRHIVWAASDPAAYAPAFAQVPLAYVADGHHRSASAWRAGKELRERNGAAGELESDWFLAVLFPADQLQILPYNRVVKDGATPQTAADVLGRLACIGRVTETKDPVPPRPGTFCVYPAAGGPWYLVEINEDAIDRADPIRSLDVSLLQELVLSPIYGIGDPRTDKRIDFVGGIRGTAELERRVNSGEMAAAFSMYPTTIDQLIAVADAGAIMPPKSTWFEPKLRSGLFVHPFSNRLES